MFISLYTRQAYLEAQYSVASGAFGFMSNYTCFSDEEKGRVNASVTEKKLTIQ